MEVGRGDGVRGTGYGGMMEIAEKKATNNK